MKKLFIDVETGGTDPGIHGLIQISGILDIDNEPIETIDLKIQPVKGKTLEPEALAVNGTTEEDILSYLHPEDAYKMLINFMGKYVDRFDRTDKFHFIGYNARFDADFIRAFFKDFNDNYFGSWFYWPPIDITNLAAIILMDERPSMPNFKLMTVAKKMGINIDEDSLHDAFYDILITMRLFKNLMQRIK